MLESGFNPRLKNVTNLNVWFKEHLLETLDDKTARLTLAQFLRNNLGLTYFLLTGGESLYPFQELMLNSWMNCNFNLNIVSRGGAKSFQFGIFCAMYPLFYSDTRIVITSANFRSSRRIFEHVEKMVDNPNATMLRNCFSENPSHKNDQYLWKINGGSLVAVPLSNGDGLRGLRANVLGIDELLLLSEGVIEDILKPFLVAKQNQQKLMRLKAEEDILISKGLMKEEDRESEKSTAKFIGLSSASYKFEYLYSIYKQYIQTIMSEEKKTARHCIFQLSWDSLPSTLIDKTIANEFKGGAVIERAGNKREFGAQFTDDSEGYFSAKKMLDCTVSDGHQPCAQIVGNKGEEYMITIDPSYSSSKSSDFFAMQTHSLNIENRNITLVHSYGVAGGDLKNHIRYFFFLLTNFNIVYIVIDASGTEFIDACNESVLFKEAGLHIGNFGADFDCEGQDYQNSLKLAKRNYRLIDKKILMPQLFNSTSIRRMNEYLQNQIDNKKVWFASKIAPNETMLKKYMALDIPADLIFKPDGSDDNKEKLNKLDFIEQQDFWLDETKKQTALIEIKATAQGTQTFDLPDHLKRSKSAKRARRDHYTCLLLASWGAKCYFDLITLPNENCSTFTPIFIR